jgi:Zn-finger nucleic acid-binding protein
MRRSWHSIGAVHELRLTITEARCPSCETALQQLPTAAGVIAGCFACGGLWVDNVGATTMVNHGVPREVIALVGALPSPDGPTEAQDQDYRTSARSARRCPVCAVPLEARGIRVADGRVEVDVCDAHGTFFDPRELAAVSGGFMLARRRFDELQAEADRVRDAATPAEVSLDPVLGPLLTALAEASRPRREWNE